MKLARYTQGGDARLGLATEAGMIDIAAYLPGLPRTMLEVAAQWEQWRPSLAALATENVRYLPLADIKLLSPIERAGKILGIGLNYADHAAEAAMELPKEQLWFSKAPLSLSGPYDGIELPRVSTALDYEAELVVVIGKRCKHVKREDAAGVILGYCAGNDVSVRDWQFKTTQFNIGKSFDTHAPIGPWIVTADSIDPHHLDIRCLVNGELRQNSNTHHFIFDCYAMIAFLSQAMTLEPGDLLFTGTPSGVGAVMKPPKWLQEGDAVRVEIDGIGAIENRVVKEV